MVERNSEGEVMMPRYNCVTTHTARRSGITNMYLTHKYSILQMMHVSGHKTQKTSWITSSSLPMRLRMRLMLLPMVRKLMCFSVDKNRKYHTLKLYPNFAL